MKKFGLLSSSAMGSAALFGLSLAFAAPAFAQDDPPPPPPPADQADQAEQGGQNVEVTGTRIRRPNIESNVPIVSVTADEIADGDPNVGDALNDLPSLRSTFSQANSTRFIGTTGLNLLDLRGLGTSRTLVLVNGRRHITGTPGDFDVDVNTIPSDLIERIDVITGGSSAVYGSDAVAGVVNFVLRRDYDGIRLRGQGGVSQQGDRAIEFVSLTAGRNFADDRANIAISLEYVNAEALYFSDRPGLTGAVDGRCQINASEFTGPPGQTPTEPRTGDGVPDATFLCNVRNAAISNGGTVAPAGVTAATCQNPAILQPANAALAARCLNPGTPSGQPRIYRFTADNRLIEDVPCLDLRPYPTGNGGNYIACPTQPADAIGSTLRDTGLIAPGLDRYSANLLFHFDISEAFRPFVEAKYVHLFSRQEGQPSFFQGGLLGTFACNNPFVTAQHLAQLQAVGRCANPATGTFPVSRFNVDFGGRSELVTRDTYRAVVGIDGDFNEDWNYQIAVSYGRLDVHQDELNDLVLTDADGNFDGYLLAFDAVRNAGGQIVCRVNQVTVTRPDCVPINVFGVGRPSQAALDFVNTTSFVDQRATQTNAVAYVNGDLSQLFELPGGPIRFVIGGEYRRETVFLQADPLSTGDNAAGGGTFFNAFHLWDPPAFKVLEAFGEIEIPLLRDLPFAQELTVTAAARYSDYNTSAGNTFSYNINGTWAPVRDIRFRANYSKSVRVPTLSDLTFPATQNFNFVADPCDAGRINGGSGTRAANCAALGVPPGFVSTFANTQTIEIISSGNPFLTEETGRSLTLGTVITPRWVPGLSITVDYYRIRVQNLIAVLSAQTILNQCVDLPTINNQFCQLIFARQTVDNPATIENDIGALQNPALISAGVNFARQKADGIDIEVSYRRTFENGHRLNIRGIATYVIRRDNYVDPLNPAIQNRQLSELGDPQWSANLSLSYGMGPVDFRYTMNYIGPMTIGAYEQYFQIPGDANNTPTNVDANGFVWYPDVLYHAARISYRVNERFQFYAGVDNIFDTPPPLGVFGTGAGDPFDPIGRYFYAGATIDF